MPTITIYEGFPSRETVSGGDSPSVVLNWVVLGTSDDLLVKATVRSTTPTIYSGLFLQTVTSEETAPETWNAKARYGVRKPPQRNEYKFSFDTTGGRQKITQSLETIHRYASPSTGKPAPDHGGAIGVTDHGVEGCEIVVPKFSWTETWQLPIEDYGWAYSQVLKAITGKVNASPFRGFPAGQVLFRGGKGSGSNKDPELIEISYQFDQSDDVEAQTIGDITGVSKAGWQYLWVQYREHDDQDAKDFCRRPVAAYVEKVYYPAAFSALAIG
jgi:hypothetical protein